MNQEVFAALAEALERGEEVALVTIVAAQGSTPQRVGAKMQVFIEPVEASPEVYVFGAGHVGYFVAKLAHEVGFRVHVVDDREKFASAERFPTGVEVIVDDIPSWLTTHQFPTIANP